MPGTVPVFESVGAALAFVRAKWRFVLVVAMATALAQSPFLLFGANLIWVIAVMGAFVAAYAVLTAAALNVRRAGENRVVADTGRLAAAMAIVGLLLIVMSVVILFAASIVLTAPYQQELKAAGEDQAAINAIVNRVLTEQQGSMSWITATFAVLVFAVTTRLYLAAPATIDQRRIVVFESWRMTRGNFLRIAGARLLLLAPAFVFVSALQTLVGYALGAPTGDPIALLAFSRSNPVGFAVFYTASIFLQFALYGPLEAGLSSYLYRGLNSSTERTMASKPVPPG
jgi:hypothetical protein